MPTPAALPAEDGDNVKNSAAGKEEVANPEKPRSTSLLSKISDRFDDHSAEAENTELVLLGSEVSPGTSTRLIWQPMSGFVGLSDPTPILVVNGVKAGPRLCLTAAVHGDELNGIEVVRHILYSTNAEELSGTLIGVPIVNLQGFRRSSRYLADRRDLNRYFPGNTKGSSAARIANSFFKNVVSNCDALVDLHTGSFHRTNLPQLRADLRNPKVLEMARAMGPIVAVQSSGLRGSLRTAAADAGIPAVTLEAGRPLELEQSDIDQGIRSVESLMDALGMIKKRKFWEFKPEPMYYRSRWVRAKEGGMLFSNVELGQRVHEGDLLGKVTDPITNAKTDIYSPFNGRIIGMALNQVMQPGFAAFHIGLQSSAESAAEADDPTYPDYEDLDPDGAPINPENTAPGNPNDSDPPDADANAAELPEDSE